MGRNRPSPLQDLLGRIVAVAVRERACSGVHCEACCLTERNPSFLPSLAAPDDRPLVAGSAACSHALAFHTMAGEAQQAASGLQKFVADAMSALALGTWSCTQAAMRN